MSKRNRWSILAVILTALGSLTARANTISIPNGVITSGSATSNPYGFSGDVQGLNFSVYGMGNSISQYNGGVGCQLYLCLAPGSYFLHDGTAGVPDERVTHDSGGGYFVKDGVTYGCGYTGFFGTCGFGIDIGYALNLPDPGPSPPYEMVLTVPLRVDASLAYLDREGNSFLLIARGVGRATVTFENVYEDYYVLQSAQYNFFAVPEPGTMALAGLGLLGVILLRRRAASAAGRT